MNELLLVVTIAGERVALPAASVESVVELDTLIAVPRAAPHVAGLSALRSRVLTVIDFAAVDHDVIHADRDGEVSGVALINGEPAELVDAHWLFARHVGASARQVEQLVCKLPSDDPWMQNMLRPIVEAAGYQVVGEDEDVEADLVIASQGSEVAEESAKRTIWLRQEPETSGKKDESIYRYDRAGLLMALKAAGSGRGK